MKIFHLFITVSSLTALCLSSYAVVSERVIDDQIATVSATVQEKAPSGRVLTDQVFKDITALKTQLASLETAMKSVSNSTTPASLSENELAELTDLKQEVATLREQWQETAARQQQDDSNGQADVWFAEDLDLMEEEQTYTHAQTINRLDDTLQAEAIDNQWSTETTDLILQALDTENLVNTGLVGSECRSSLCRVEVSHDNEMDFEEFQLWFALEVGEVLPMATMDQQIHEDGSVSSVLYLAREGFDLPVVE